MVYGLWFMVQGSKFNVGLEKMLLYIYYIRHVKIVLKILRKGNLCCLSYERK